MEEGFSCLLPYFKTVKEKWHDSFMSAYTYTMPSNSNTSSSSNSNVFRTYPQRFPKARQRATELVRQLFELQRKGPRTLIAEVVDTSYHATQSYVTCTTQLGVVQVVGVPLGTVVPHMRIYARQMGGAASNRGFVFDGYAPGNSALGQTSGSLVMTTPTVGSPTAAPAASANNAITSTSITSSTGYYWHCFFYIPVLPSGIVTIFQMTQTSSANILYLEYLPTGYVRLRSQDTHGYVSTIPVPPHQVHYVQIQPTATAGSFLVDGLSNYTGIANPSDNVTFTGTSNTYGIGLLGNRDGTARCPVGSWVSKFGFGTAWTGSALIPLLSSVPTSDSLLPGQSGNLGSAIYLLLCEDTPGGTTLTNSGSGGANSTTVDTTVSVISSLGPY